MDNRWSIYHTAEAESWSRGFRYSDYMFMHQRMGVVAIAFSERGYKSFCAMMDDEMERDMRNG